MEKKGQALVEFIIILPILIVILLGIIDFGLIIYKKNILETALQESALIYRNTKSRENVAEYLNQENKELSLTWYENQEYLTLEIKQGYNFLTPGLDLIFGENYKIDVKRVIYNG